MKSKVNESSKYLYYFIDVMLMLFCDIYINIVSCWWGMLDIGSMLLVKISHPSLTSIVLHLALRVFYGVLEIKKFK
ncbi:hypothetical protein BgiBS90_037148, partial [Biomphalaria glabrata]